MLFYSFINISSFESPKELNTGSVVIEFHWWRTVVLTVFRLCAPSSVLKTVIKSHLDSSTHFNEPSWASATRNAFTIALWIKISTSSVAWFAAIRPNKWLWARFETVWLHPPPQPHICSFLRSKRVDKVNPRWIDQFLQEKVIEKIKNHSCGILTSTPQVFRRRVLLQKLCSDPKANQILNKSPKGCDKPEYKHDKMGQDL